jgi:non-canonical purine NTP pyrophosphatase (RdgB/HAM1 family)
MLDVTFITGNQNKADYLAKYLGEPINHKKLDLEEIQSLDLSEVVERKARDAYEQVKSPVVVDDVSVEFKALGRLPGTFIRWFLDDIGPDAICRLLDGKDRSAIARCAICYFDGTTLRIFEGISEGTIAKKPEGSNGYGWDVIFIPNEFSVTSASLSEDDYRKFYFRVKPVDKLKSFLISK